MMQPTTRHHTHHFNFCTNNREKMKRVRERETAELNPLWGKTFSYYTDRLDRKRQFVI